MNRHRHMPVVPFFPFHYIHSQWESNDEKNQILWMEPCLLYHRNPISGESYLTVYLHMLSPFEKIFWKIVLFGLLTALSGQASHNFWTFFQSSKMSRKRWRVTFMLMRDNNDKIIVFKYIFEGPDNKQRILTFGMCFSFEGGCHWSTPNFCSNEPC